MSLLSWVDETKINYNLLFHSNPNREMVLSYISKMGIRSLPMDAKLQITEYFNDKPTYAIGYKIIELHPDVYGNKEIIKMIAENMHLIYEYDLCVLWFDQRILYQYSWALPILMEYPYLLSSDAFKQSDSAGDYMWFYPFLEKYPNKFRDIDVYLEWMLPILSANIQHISPGTISAYEWAMPLLTKYHQLRDYDVLSKYIWAMPLLVECPDLVNYDVLSDHEWGLSLIRDELFGDRKCEHKREHKIGRGVNIAVLSSHRWALPLLLEHPELIKYNIIAEYSWSLPLLREEIIPSIIGILSSHEWALHILEANINIVDYGVISKFHWAVPLITRFLAETGEVDRINWNDLSGNEAAVPLLFKYPYATDQVSTNKNAIDFIKAHPHLISPMLILENSNAKDIILEYKFDNSIFNKWNNSPFVHDYIHNDLLHDADLAHIIITKIMNTETALEFIAENERAAEAFILNFHHLNEEIKKCIIENAHSVEFIAEIDIEELNPYTFEISKNSHLIEFLIINGSLIDWDGVLVNPNLDVLLDELLIDIYDWFTDEQICKHEILFNVFHERWTREQNMKKKMFELCSNPLKLDKIKKLCEDYPQKVSWDGISVNPAILM